jgi:hypothetical protein
MQLDLAFQVWVSLNVAVVLMVAAALWAMTR